MSSIKSLAIAATIALSGLTGISAQAAEQQWTGRPQAWKSPTVSQCKLVVQRVYQPNQGQPIHLVVKNDSTVRLQYTINVRVIRDRKEAFRGTMSVDNANGGEVSERPTQNAYSGTLDGATVMLSLASCALRS